MQKKTAQIQDARHEAPATVAVWKQVTLEPPQQSINGVGHQWNDHEHEQDWLPLTAPLRHVNQVTKTTRCTAKLHQFSQHHIPK